ncbi:hypothetical protein [Saccharospirillum impatiens]|uniref:hypothetical protein n=1 Tax=Saccharospirillum impatiens TaxID=169438 RepID=UPI0012FBBB09|nr:hypothetical protein [Saccharospirillum impatiens]
MLSMLTTAFVAAEQISGARFAKPVDRYGHFALGRPHEYAQLVATTDRGQDVVLELPGHEVFEDLSPRMVTLTDHGAIRLLAIVSSVDQGARLVLFKLEENQLAILAQSAPIGTPNRWLNPVGVADLNDDGEAEVAAVITPHIGGTLKVYRREGARLVEIDSLPGFSNHVYGSAELELSRAVLVGGHRQLLVPDVSRKTIRAIRLTRDGLTETERCFLSVPVTGPEALGDCDIQLNSSPGSE